VLPKLWILWLYASFPGLITIIVVPILSLYWYFRATKNIHSFGAKGLTSPKMAVIWWFVPILQLWKPYFVSQQIWKASNPEMNIREGNEWKTSPSSNLIKVGWLLFLIAAIGLTSISIIHDLTTGRDSIFPTYNIMEERDTPQKFLRLVFDNIFTTALIFFVIMIRKVSIRQELKSSNSI
jgi:hypothetical protein